MTVGRYSKYIRPISYLIDLLIIVWLLLFIFPVITLGIKSALLLISFWIIIANYTSFYDVYRFTAESEILSKIIKQVIVFSLVFIALIFSLERSVQPVTAVKYLVSLLVIVTFFKFGIYYSLKKYRSFLGGNYRNVIIIGKSKESEDLANFFKQNDDFGYKLFTILDPKTDIEEIKAFVLEKSIDELYCDLNSVAKERTDEVIAFSHSAFKTIKLVPDKSALSHNMFLDYYGYIPVISIRKTPLEMSFNYSVKRIFDILFSVLIILFVLSWLIPLITILIKLDSKGPIFFKQKRHGLNNNEFDCLKFRSMVVNETADTELVSRNDVRITKLGRFLRKSSIDEMPQFFNVLLGDMSVVGPRPHMLSVNEDYAQRFDKFMERHYIKPGVTGLAQTKGFRGEINSDKDVENRLKYDLYYIENWSLFLDIKIILMTMKSFILGDEKAY